MNETIKENNKRYSNIEVCLMNLVSSGKNTFDELKAGSGVNDRDFNVVLEGMLAKNILSYNRNTGKYEYVEPLEGEILVLDGNVLLPMTVITLGNRKIVSRGKYYEFPLDFDVRRIVWNVKLDPRTNSTLVDLIQNSVLKEKKANITQVEAYKNLVNKVIPYSKKIGLLLNVVGDEATDVHVMFKVPITTGDITFEFCKFKVRSLISTPEMIDELKKPANERDYTNIKLNRIHDLTDFTYVNNEIPVSSGDGFITVARVTGIKKFLQLTYFKVDTTGNYTRLNTEELPPDTSTDRFQELFSGLPSMILASSNFNVEMTE
jgi:hypothetical protein